MHTRGVRVVGRAKTRAVLARQGDARTRDTDRGAGRGRVVYYEYSDTRPRCARLAGPAVSAELLALRRLARDIARGLAAREGT